MAGSGKGGSSLRVLLISGSFPPLRCGVGDYTASLARSLAVMAGNKVAVLTSDSSSEADPEPLLDVFRIMRSWTLAETHRVAGVIRRWSPDVVHVQYPTTGYRNRFLPWVVPLVAFSMGKTVVQTWHEAYSRRQVLRALLAASVPSAIVVVRPQYQDLLLPVLRHALRNRKFTYVRNASGFHVACLTEGERKTLRNGLLRGQRSLVLFVGFVHPQKGLEDLFSIADPSRDHIVIVGEAHGDGVYERMIQQRATDEHWSGKVTFKGFLPVPEVSELLSIADAVVLPFRDGGGEWNTSIHGAVLQGTFVLTTSRTRSGYDATQNVYYANVNDTRDMKSALDRYAGRRRIPDPSIDSDPWRQIAQDHESLYQARMAGEG